MNEKLFDELEELMLKRKNCEKFLEELQKDPYINKIVLSKGMIGIYLDNSDIEMLIYHYKNKIKLITKKIDKFKLSKTIY